MISAKTERREASGSTAVTVGLGNGKGLPSSASEVHKRVLTLAQGWQGNLSCMHLWRKHDFSAFGCSEIGKKKEKLSLRVLGQIEKEGILW